MLSGRCCPVLSVRFGWSVAPMWPQRSIQRPHPYHSCCRAPIEKSAQLSVTRVTVRDRQCPSESAADGTQMARGDVSREGSPSRLAAIADPAGLACRARPGLDQCWYAPGLRRPGERTSAHACGTASDRAGSEPTTPPTVRSGGLTSVWTAPEPPTPTRRAPGRGAGAAISPPWPRPQRRTQSKH
jgi:hypothetical protein